MSTNLIDNYIIAKKQPAAVTTSVAQKPEVKAPIKNMKPLQPKGHLIKQSFYDAPVDIYESVAYDIKSLKNGLKGNSNDHQLGKINDLGMKLGGLAIAGFLFTQKPTPKTKWMEIAGFGSFFASMALWPKIALQWPAKVVHGFDTQQKYEDSMGRKKSFFSDPQYLPWDLYSDKEINKIGDRLGIDKDVPNRKEFVQEKMKKIAVQNNTMWMLTAGFATPVISALISSEVEKHLGKAQDKVKNVEIEDSLSNYEENAKKLDFSEYDKKLEEVFATHKNKQINPEMLQEIAKAMAPETHFVGEHLPADLEKMFGFKNNTYVVNDKSIEQILDGAKETMKRRFKVTDEQLTGIASKEAVIQVLKDNGFFETELDEKGISNASDEINTLLVKTADKSPYYDELENLSDVTGDIVEDGLKLNRGNLLDDAKIKQIKELSKPIQNFEKEAYIISDYLQTKLGSAQETVHANDWNNTAPKLINIFGITPREIEKTKGDRVQVQKFMRTKLESIVTNDKKYKRVMSDLAELLKTLDSTIVPEHIEASCSKIDKSYNKAAAEMMSRGMREGANQLIGWKFRLGEMETISDDIANGARSKRQNANIAIRLEEWGLESDFTTAKNQLDRAIDMVKNSKSAGDLEKLFNENKLFNVNEVGSIKRLKKDFARENRNGVKASFYGLVDTIDLMRRISKGNFGPSLPPTMKQEVVEESIEMAVKTLFSGHTADYYNKFYTQRNPIPDLKPGHPKVKNGKVENEFYGVKGRMIDHYKNGKPIPYQTVEIPYDHNFFKNVIRFMFENDMDSATKDSLKGSLLNEIKEFRKNKFIQLGNLKKEFKDQHIVSNIEALNNAANNGDVDALRELEKTMTTSEKAFKTLGMAFDEMFTKLFNQKFNTTKWLSIFGKGAIVLTGITLASQFFFGNLPNPKGIKEGENK